MVRVMLRPLVQYLIYLSLVQKIAVNYQRCGVLTCTVRYET